MKVLLLAGEESGVLYAERIRAALPSGAEIRGYGDLGFETGDLAVMGFWPVLKKIFFFLRVKRTMEREIDTWRPDVVCTIDYPGLNLALAAYAKRRGIRTVHVVCPQVWAWKKGRIPKIEASVDRLCCFFPFEPGYFRAGFAEFVGHPLVGQVSRNPDVRREERLVALLPGSRVGEIVKHLPTMLKAAEGWNGARLEIPAANARAELEIRRILSKSPLVSRVSVLRGGARDLLGRAACAVVASGTATLEAALMGCPTLLVYRVSPLLAAFARCVIRDIRHVGLVNVIWEKCRPDSDRFPMPELLQEAFTASAVSCQVASWLDDPSARGEVSSRLAEASGCLSGPGDPISRIAAICAGE